MSLFSDASLAMIPSAYKDGKLYSIKPTDGSGDFTFTRGSNLAATRVDVNGLIEKGRENLLLQSNQFDTTWQLLDSGVNSGQSGYDGSSDAWLLRETATNGYHYIRQSVTTGLCTFSFYAKKKDYDYIQFAQSGDGGNYGNFNISNGTLGNANPSFFIDRKIEAVGNGWYRCSVTYIIGSGGYVGIALIRSDVSTRYDSYLGDITKGTYIQDAQLEQGLVATDYIETTTTTAQAGILEDMPRLDYSGGASCPSLLLEPQRTNLITNSEYGFIINNTSIEYNNAISPEGYQSAFKSTATTTVAAFTRVSDVSVSNPTISVFVKYGNNPWLNIIYSGNVNTYFNFNCLTGDFGTNVGSLTSNLKAEDYGNGWWRVSATFNYIGAGSLRAYMASSGTTGFANGTTTIGNYFYGYGFQIEQDASYPTSYIPTYGTSQTRSADNNNAPFVDIETEGTMFGEIEVVDTGTFGTPMALSVDNATTNFVLIYKTDIDKLSARIRFGGADQCLIDSGTLTEGYHKFAFRYRENDCEFFVDGVSVGTDTSVSIPTGLNVIRQYIGNSINPFVGGTKQLAYFPTALTDSECIALTQ